MHKWSSPQKTCQKFGARPQCSGARNCLDGRVTFLLDDRRILAHGQLYGAFGEFGQADNSRVFLVQFGVDNRFLGFADTRKHIGFSLIVTIRTHAEIHFLGIRVAFVGFSHAQNRVRWPHFHVSEPCRPKNGGGIIKGGKVRMVQTCWTCGCGKVLSDQNENERKFSARGWKMRENPMQIPPWSVLLVESKEAYFYFTGFWTHYIAKHIR